VKDVQTHGWMDRFGTADTICCYLHVITAKRSERDNWTDCVIS